jgi:hypothetical protein
MKKVLSISILAFLTLANAALAHSSQVVHIHPHGENAFMATWLVAAAIGAVLGGSYLAQRVRQR